MNLSHALRVTRQTRLAFVGAGGKTTAIFRLAGELPPPVLVTATTHLAVEQLARADQHIVVRSPGDVPAMATANGVALFTGPVGEDGRARGVARGALEQICQRAAALNCPLLIESDGSRQRPLKAPAEHEPPIPDFVDTVVVVAGLSGLGRPLSPDWVHRPERFAALTGLAEGTSVTAAALMGALLHPEGGQKNIPAHARLVALLNQADTVALQSQARGMVEGLLAVYQAVGISSFSDRQDAASHLQPPVLAMHERIAGVVLAAGASRRMGQPKQLLDWQGKPLARHAAQVALEAGLSPVVVVTGAFGEQVAETVAGLPVSVAHNPAWEAGQSTSVRRGLAALPSDVGGAAFLLVDQPFVTAPLVRALVDEHARTLAPIVAPLIDEQRGNPVLFDRVTFADFESLQGDTGARTLFARHRAVWVPWHDPRARLDVDTMGDYDHLISH